MRFSCHTFLAFRRIWGSKLVYIHLTFFKNHHLYGSPNLAFLESREMRDWGNKISRDCEISRDYISSTNIDSKIENKGFIFIFTRNFQNQLKILVLKLWFVKKNVLIIEIHVNLLIFCWKLDKNQGKNSISISQISHYKSRKI